MVDGVDGAGKTTIINTWKKFLRQNNRKIFGIREYWQQNQNHPEFEQLKDYDFIFSAEPTSVWTGAALRKEMIKQDSDYSGKAIAEAFSLDRLVLYKRLLLKLLNEDVSIIQDRGISTSLCYQPLQSTELTREKVANLEGNAFALKNNPEYLILADLPIEDALERLDLRQQQDDSVFEKRKFLNRARETFLSKEYQDYFIKQGTEIKKLDTSVNIDIMKEKSVSLLQNILNIN